VLPIPSIELEALDDDACHLVTAIASRAIIHQVGACRLEHWH
jgi:hypothetical protein